MAQFRLKTGEKIELTRASEGMIVVRAGGPGSRAGVETSLWLFDEDAGRLAVEIGKLLGWAEEDREGE